jgi:DNA-binding transcriptional LysR family regulator
MQRSKLSRRIAELEQRMGVRLLQRNTRRVLLTPAGERVYEHARAVQREARAAFDVGVELRGEAVGTVRITTSSALAGVPLMPVVAEFCALHPRVHVVVDANDRRSDLVGENFELAFRAMGSPPEDSSLVARLVGDVPMVVAGPASLRSALAKITGPEDLKAHGLLALSIHDGVKTLEFERPVHESHTLRYEARMSSGNMPVLLSAVLNGLGLAYLPKYLCSPYFASGDLVDVFGDADGWRPKPARVFALMPAARGIALATRLFLDFSLPRLARRIG